MSDAPAETRVYTYTGKRAHLLAAGVGANSNTRALCGFVPVWHSQWHGTGSQAEYEKAAALPTCAYCAKRVRQDAEAERTALTRGAAVNIRVIDWSGVIAGGHVDFPRAWEIARSVPPEQHPHPKCSFRQTNGALLCDCDVLFKHPEYTGGEPA